MNAGGGVPQLNMNKQRRQLVVGLGHRAGAGKDTCADHLVREYGFTKIPFAKALKEAARAICRFTDEQLYGSLEQKERRDSYWGFSARHFLQRMGTEVGRAIEPNLWVMAWALEAGECDRVVVSDVRFPNEGDAIHDHGGIVLCVDRPGLPAEKHASETSMEGWEGYDAHLWNGTTIPELHARLDAILMAHDTHKIPQRDALPLATDHSVMLERFSTCHPGAIYEHYKGPRYTVHALARQHDTREYRVVYSGATQETSDRLAFDQREGFFQDVEWRGDRVPRFSKVLPEKK